MCSTKAPTHHWEVSELQVVIVAVAVILDVETVHPDADVVVGVLWGANVPRAAGVVGVVVGVVG